MTGHEIADLCDRVVRCLLVRWPSARPFGDDLRQEAAVGALQAARSYRAGRGASLRTWMEWRSTGACLDFLRRECRARRIELRDELEPEPASHPDFGAIEAGDEIRELLLNISVLHHEILRGFSNAVEEESRRLRCTHAGIWGRRNRARAAARAWSVAR